MYKLFRQEFGEVITQNNGVGRYFKINNWKCFDWYLIFLLPGFCCDIVNILCV